MKNRRIAEYLVEGCAALGIRHIFGVDGANIEDVYDAAAHCEVDVHGIVAKHEFSAAAMADGYARATSGLGVVLATSGGGAMNLVAGLAESFTSGVPILAMIGQPPRNMQGHGAFQDTSGLADTIDALRLFSSVSVFCERVEHPADLPEQFAKAVVAALRGGPAVLLLPKDIQRSEIDLPLALPSPNRADIASGADVDAVAAAVSSARGTGRILLIAGEQVAKDDARAELRDLAMALNAAVAVTPESKDLYGPHDPGFVGIAGTMGHPGLPDIARNAALCLLVGTRLPATAHIPLDHIPIAGIGARAPYLPAVFAPSSNLSFALPLLTCRLRELDSGTTSLESDQAQPMSLPEQLQPPTSTGPGLRYREVMETISRHLRPGSAVFADAGNTGAAAVHYLDLSDNTRFGLALGMGGMGHSFGAAIGAAFADPRPTYVIAGDGSFLMHGMEIHTAIEYALPITFIILNNNAHAMCVIRDQLYGRNHNDRNRFRPAMLAEGMAAMFPDLPCHAVRDLDQLFDALAVHADNGPNFIAIDCDPDEIPPYASFLTDADGRRRAVFSPTEAP